MLDFSHLFFTQKDVDELTAKYGGSMAPEVLLGNIKPGYDIYALYTKRVDDRVAKIKELLKQPLEFSLALNDKLVQKGSSADMIFSFHKIIADISQYFALNIGDLIYTGTPAGVGECLVGDVLKGCLGNEQVFELEIK